MAEYVYITTPAKLKEFLSHIQSSGVPPELTYKTLASFGLKSSNDRPIIKVMKFIGFATESGVPTDLWKKYRDRQSAPKVLGQAIQSSYSDLFSMYPDAHKRDTTTLKNFFAANTAFADRSLAAIVGTFRALCELADFGAQIDHEQKQAIADRVGPVDDDSESATSTAVHILASTQAQTRDSMPPEVHSQLKSPQGLNLNINIQLHLPATQDGEVYDKLFEALKRHLLQG